MGLIACFMMPLTLGATVLSIDPFEWVARPRLMLDAISRGRAQFAWIPNFGLAHLINAVPDPSGFDLSSIKALINCSEPCKPATHQRFVGHFSSANLRPEALQACYAMAENVFAVTQTPVGRAAASLEVDRDSFDLGLIRSARRDAPAVQLVSCGVPLDAAEVRIVSEDRSPAQPGCIGEIAIRSDTLFSGYNRRTDLTQEVLDCGWYYTNDLGFMYEGELYVTGRRDDLILAYGRNYFAHELEAVVNTVAGVRPGRATAFGIESDTTGTREVVVLFEAEAAADTHDLVKAVRRRLEAAAGLQPRHVEAVAPGSLIKTTSGKISRSENREAFSRTRKAS
jgi:acyl-CoA synthetase (AMP-forming)/AMP-acid ligase II